MKRCCDGGWVDVPDSSGGGAELAVWLGLEVASCCLCMWCVRVYKLAMRLKNRHVVKAAKDRAHTQERAPKDATWMHLLFSLTDLTETKATI